MVAAAAFVLPSKKSKIGSAGDEVPERMITGNRVPDPIFQPSEILAQRCSLCHLEGDKPAPSLLPSPAYSVNRTKFGPAEDVELPAAEHEGCGFFTYTAGDIPPAYTHTDNLQYSFRILHLPEPLNYHHSEIRTFMGDVDLAEEVPEKKAPKLVRKYFRTALAHKAVLAKRPTT
jgi:hypothetical protein